MSLAPIRVLVVDDSLTVRAHICEALSADPEIQVVGVAGDGREAIELCRALRPDVITLDMMLPVMSGLAATEFIMAHFPTPILIVSASTNRGELFKTYDALAAGAVDVLDKPGSATSGDQWEARLVAAVKLISRIKVITHPRARLAALGHTVSSRRRRPVLSGASRPPGAAAIGVSTGGPAALVSVLGQVPTPLLYPLFVVIHIGEPFGVAFADWLGAQTGHTVAYARDGQPVAAGEVTMAPPNWHLLVRDGRLRLNQEPERHSCRPSIDVLFESLALEYGPDLMAALLTGMGRDGASGLLAIRQAGGVTIAQDEASSVVYGMPREAVRLGAAAHVLPLVEIGAAFAAVAPGAVE
jgi:two-component system chemotaxis response regulator CheB